MRHTQIQNEIMSSLQQKTVLAERLKGLRTEYKRIKIEEPSLLNPEELLDESDDSVRRCLAKILGISSRKPEKLIQRLCFLSQGLLGEKINGKYTYAQVVAKCCLKLKLNVSSSAVKGEQTIALHCFRNLYKKLSPQEQEKFNEALKKESDSLKKLNPSLNPAFLSAGAIVAGNMSGFGIYLASSTVVGAVTSTMGITLPFAFYTSMSSAISIFLGPVGWIAVGAMVASTLLGADWEKVIKGIIFISSIRSEKQLKWELERKDREKEIDALSNKINMISAKIIRMRFSIFVSSQKFKRITLSLILGFAMLGLVLLLAYYLK